MRLQTNLVRRGTRYYYRGRVPKERALTRDKAIAGILEGIALAKEQGNPVAQISGWREIGKMLGFCAPEQHTVKLSAESRAWLCYRSS